MHASKNDTPSCWYNVDTYNVSEDGGYHFARPVSTRVVPPEDQTGLAGGVAPETGRACK